MTPDLLPPNMAAKVLLADSGCWEWTGATTSRGYSCVCPGGGKTALGHRFAYESLVGPIPSGLQIDHLCRNKVCINPAHLEPVTGAENMRRAKAVLTHCPKGHPYDEANTFYKRGARQCRECARAYNRAWDRRQRANRADVEALRGAK